MATQANITVFDGASTPVTHTLVGEEVRREAGNTSLAIWREQINSVPLAAQITATQIKRKLKSGVHQIVSRVEVPVMEAIAGPNSFGYTAQPKVAFTERFEFVRFAHERSTEVSARTAMQILINWVNNVTTTVTPVSTGVVADAHQRMQQPT